MCQTLKCTEQSLRLLLSHMTLHVILQQIGDSTVQESTHNYFIWMSLRRFVTGVTMRRILLSSRPSFDSQNRLNSFISTEPQPKGSRQLSTAGNMNEFTMKSLRTVSLNSKLCNCLQYFRQ